jgi:hypothetical protein
LGAIEVSHVDQQIDHAGYLPPAQADVRINTYRGLSSIDAAAPETRVSGTSERFGNRQYRREFDPLVGGGDIEVAGLNAGAKVTDPLSA